jgi:hypothetical protein
MLADRDLTSLTSSIALFDHDWRFYTPLLGEPFLIEDTLVYFDGAVLYICAFSILNVWTELDTALIAGIAHSRPEFHQARVINVWGRFRPTERFVLFDRNMPSVKQTDYDHENFDTAIDLLRFDFKRDATARRARNSARNKGLTFNVVQRQELLNRHIKLIEQWRSSHSVSRVHACMASSLASTLSYPSVFLVESYRNEELLGFGLLSFPSPKRAVLLQSFGANSPGGRVGDSIMTGAVTFSRDRGASHLHLGYSTSSTLLAFKRKWGARIDGPPFREAFYTDSQLMKSLIRGGRYLWQQRVIEGLSRG